MKHIITLLLCLALFFSLFACGRAEPEITTAAPTTTEAETTAGAETTTEEAVTEELTTKASATGQGVRWRVLDLDDAQNSDINKWLDEWIKNQERERDEQDARIKEHPMGNGKTVLGKPRSDGHTNLVLRDKAGKETILVKSRYLGESDDPLQDELNWIGPSICKILDDRFFLYVWYGWEWTAGFGIYDIEEMKDIPFDTNQLLLWPCLVADDTLLYMKDSGDGGPYSGELHLLAYDLNALRRGEKMKGVNLLAGIPHKPADYETSTDLTPDGRFFIVVTDSELYIFDLRSKTLLLYLPKASLGVQLREGWVHAYFEHIAMRDEHTLYWFTNNHNFENYMVEITLP